MQLMKFGSFYIHLEKIAYVHKFTPDVLPASAVKARNVGRVRIGLVRGTKNFFRLPLIKLNEFTVIPQTFPVARSNREGTLDQREATYCYALPAHRSRQSSIRPGTN